MTENPGRTPILPWTMDKQSNIQLLIPFWKLMEMPPEYLKWEIDRIAREFGYTQMKRQAAFFDEVTVELRISQRWKQGKEEEKFGKVDDLLIEANKKV